MNKHPLSPHDWEALSAYLDGEMSTRERVSFEKALQTRADLQLALEGLRKTRAVLRSQTLMRAPRNFTLTPEMAGIKQGRTWVSNAYKGFQLSAALASFLFVFVVLGEVLAGGFLARGPAMAPQPAMQFALEQAPEPTSESLAMTNEAEVAAVETTQVEMEEAAKAYDAGEAGIGAGPSGTAPVGMGGEIESPAPTSMPMTEVQLVAETPTAIPAEEMVTAGMVITPTYEIMAKGAYPPPVPDETTVTDQSYLPAMRIAKEPTIETWSPWRIVEIVLFILAVSSGFAALILRRNRRA